MDAILKTLVLKRFRSFPAETVVLVNPTILVGRNGSGKSNFKDAFDFLAEAMVSPLQAVLDRRGGIEVVRNRAASKSRPGNLGVGVTLGELGPNIASARYAFELRAKPDYGFDVVREQCIVEPNGSGGKSWFDRNGTTFRTNVGDTRPQAIATSLCLPIVGGVKIFAPVVEFLSRMRSYSIEPAKIRELQDPEGGLGLKADGSNLASVLQEIRRRDPVAMGRITELLGAVVPNTTAVAPVKHGKKLSLQFTQEWGANHRLNFESFSMSDGTLRALGLMAAVFQRPAPSVLIIEEPEATIHPGALGAILDVIHFASRQMQVLVTTHSPDALDADWLRESNLRIVTWEMGASRILPLAEGSRTALGEHLMSAGELLRSNAFRPTASSTAPVPELFEVIAA